MNILIVDDHPTNLELLRVQLESKGHAVLEATNGVEALAVLERERDVQAIISDILMPRMDGYRLCYEVRKSERLRDLPFIVYSSTYTAAGDEKLALDVGVDKYLRKPASVETIIAALREVIAQPHPAPRPQALPEVEVLKEYSDRLMDMLELRQAELQMIFDTVPAIIFYKDRQHRLVRVNAAFARGHGRPAGELVGKTDAELGLPHAEQYVRDEEEIAATGQPKFNIVEPVVTRAGTRWLQTDKLPIRDAAGTITGFIGFSVDITERKQAEEALRLSEARFAKAFQSNPAPMCITTVKEGRFIEVNGRYCQLFGHTREELIGRTSLELELWADPADRALLIERLQTRGFIRDHETRFRRKSRELLDALISMELIDFPGAHEPVLVSMFTDITTRKQAEDAARQRVKELELFQRLSVGRELQMVELKQQVNALSQRLGELPPYPLHFLRAEEGSANSTGPGDARNSSRLSAESQESGRAK